MSIPADFPWPHEGIVGHGTHAGIPWVARRVPGGEWMGNPVNGYIKIPEGHPWSLTDDYVDTGVPWGEITYRSGASGWIGFDTGHDGQWWPGSEIRRAKWFGGLGMEMSEELVIAWTQLFAANAALASFGVTFGDYA